MRQRSKLRTGKAAITGKVRQVHDEADERSENLL